MRIHVVFDSAYGNTERIARSIGEALDAVTSAEVVVSRVDAADPNAIGPGDILVVGSPTQGGRSTPAIDRYLAHLPDSVLEGLLYASFDTRLASRWVAVFGYAAVRIDRTLQRREALALAEPEGFLVEDKEGPLVAGELQRAGEWAAGLSLPVTH